VAVDVATVLSARSIRERTPQLSNTYTVAVGAVVTLVIVAGIRRYELQKAVAGGPNALSTVNAVLMALQSRARSWRLESKAPGTGLAIAIARVNARAPRRCIARAGLWLGLLERAEQEDPLTTTFMPNSRWTVKTL
jgi:hypothetical protein